MRSVQFEECMAWEEATTPTRALIWLAILPSQLQIELRDYWGESPAQLALKHLAGSRPQGGKAIDGETMSLGTITVRQIRSPIRRGGKQRATLVGLGLNHIGRTRILPDTPATRGMIAKVRHLVRVIEPRSSGPKLLSRRGFDALAAYTRDPQTVLIFDEMEWHATRDERVIAVLVRDRIDSDYGFVVLGRDERLRFRAIAVDASFPTADAARDRLIRAMREEHAMPDIHFHQGDAPGKPMDFFTPAAPKQRLSSTFLMLCDDERYSLARGVIEAMMRLISRRPMSSLREGGRRNSNRGCIQLSSCSTSAPKRLSGAMIEPSPVLPRRNSRYHFRRGTPQRAEMKSSRIDPIEPPESPPSAHD